MSPTAPVHAPTFDDLLGFQPPVATAVVTAPNAGEHAREQLEVRIKDMAGQLRDDGAPADVIETVVSTVRRELGGAPSGRWTGVVADAQRTVVVPLVDAPSEVVAVGHLPRFVPFVQDRFQHRPHVVVRCDRTGADIARVTRRGRADHQVEGDDQHVQKVQAGGWSQRRMQNHSEHTWEQNAREVADALVTDAEAVHATLVLITGDEQAARLIRQHVPEAWQDRLVLDDLQPTDLASDEATFERAATMVRDHVADEMAELLQRFAEHRGRGELAAEGVDDVFAALRGGAVDTLLVNGDLDDEAFVAADDPRQVARDRQMLVDAGMTQVVPARVTDAAIAAAAAGGSAVVVVPEHDPSGPSGPLGALLRY